MPKLELGPAGFLPPSAASMGIFQPEKGSNMELVEGEHVPTEKAIEKAAHEMLTRRNPTLFPGPMIVWGWNEETRHKAKLMLDMAKEIPGMQYHSHAGLPADLSQDRSGSGDQSLSPEFDHSAQQNPRMCFNWGSLPFCQHHPENDPGEHQLLHPGLVCL